MAEKIITNHSEHLRKLVKKADTNGAEAIKELVDYLVLAHSSG